MARYLGAAASLFSVHALAGKTAPLDSNHAAQLFNSWFTGTGASGVVLRQTGEWEIWCGTDCFQGRPDCTMSSSFANLEIGTDPKTGRFGGVFYFNKMAGVVFNTSLVNSELARCYYSGDGMTKSRYNGGCGCHAQKADLTCSSPHSPYANIGPDGKFVNGDSPEAERCMCKDDHVPQTERWNNCFWRGPAYNTSTGPYGSTQFPQFVTQSELTGQFTEIVLDAHAVERFLATDPASVISGVFYIKARRFEGTTDDTTANLGVAQRLQGTLRGKYGVEVPIVGLDMDVHNSPQSGPFFEHGASASDSAAEAIVV